MSADFTVSACSKRCVSAGITNGCGDTVTNSMVSSATWTSGNTAIAGIVKNTSFPLSAMLYGVTQGTTTITLTVTTTGGDTITTSFTVEVVGDSNYSVTFTGGTPVSQGSTIVCGGGAPMAPRPPRSSFPGFIGL